MIIDANYVNATQIAGKGNTDSRWLLSLWYLPKINVLFTNQ